MGIITMATLNLRPTKRGENKNQAKWLVYGSWGKQYYDPMTTSEFHKMLRNHFIRDGVLPYDTPLVSIKHHQHITEALRQCSLIDGKWMRDEPFANRLKKLREASGLTQEQLAERAEIDLGTVRQLEQGTRTNPQWQTVCALARGLGKDVTVFVGTEGYQPPHAN